MKNITSSASKLVLLSLIFVLNVIVLVAVIASIFQGDGGFGDMEKLILAMFSNALSFVLGYYFNGKGNQELRESIKEEVKNEAGSKA